MRGMQKIEAKRNSIGDVLATHIVYGLKQDGWLRLAKAYRALDNGALRLAGFRNRQADRRGITR
jgi:hypothetical protein